MKEEGTGVHKWQHAQNCVALVLSAGRHSGADAGLQRVAAQRLAPELAAQQRHGVAAGLAARPQPAAASRRFNPGRTAGSGAPQLPRPHGFAELCCPGDSPGYKIIPFTTHSDCTRVASGARPCCPLWQPALNVLSGAMLPREFSRN